MKWRVEVTRRCCHPKDASCVKEQRAFLCESMFEVEQLRQDFFDQHVQQCQCGSRTSRLLSVSEVREKERYEKD